MFTKKNQLRPIFRSIFSARRPKGVKSICSSTFLRLAQHVAALRTSSVVAGVAHWMSAWGGLESVWVGRWSWVHGGVDDRRMNFFFSPRRPFIMRSDTELLIFIFRSEKKMGHYGVRSRKIRRDKIRFENPMAQVVRFWPQIQRLDPSDCQIEKWHRSLIK